jgi:hypothetical protein
VLLSVMAILCPNASRRPNHGACGDFGLADDDTAGRRQSIPRYLAEVIPAVARGVPAD